MKKIMLLPGVIAMAACSAPANYGSAYPYQFHPELFNSKNIKRVIIADLNFGQPSRHYLQDRELYIDNRVIEYLEEHGYEVISNDIFKTYWQQSATGKSTLIDTFTGAKNQRAFKTILEETLTKLRESNNADAVIFTDLVATDVYFSAFGRHMAEWDGVMRKPQMQGAGNEGVTAEFNWYESVDAVSLAINWLDTEGKVLFSSRGGLEVTQKIDSRTTARWVRSRKLLENDRFINEAIELAFHPVITMKDYPGFGKSIKEQERRGSR